MKKSILTLVSVLIVMPAIRVKAQDVTFRVSAPPAVVAGQTFQLAYEVNSLDCTDFRAPSDFSEYFDVLFGPAISTSRGLQIINGRQTRTASTTYTFTLGAKKEGTFNVGPATVKIKNSDYKSNSFSINVLPQDKADQAQQQGRGAQQQGGQGSTASASDLSNENIFMLMTVSKRSVYEQEGFLVTFKVYSTHSMVNIEPKFPEFEGFLAQDIELKEFPLVQENYNGRNYQTVIARQAILFPQRSGQLPIGSGKVVVTLRVRTQAQTRSIFDDFFGSVQDIPKEVVSSPVTIDVKPLPSGKPANFSNAVGSFTMNSEINRTQLKANEAVTIKLSIKGNGNIRWLRNPEVKFPNDFEIFDPKPDLSTQVTTGGVRGTRNIEYMAIPRYAGDFEIPPVNFSYFDPQSGTYKTLSTESFHLQVERDENSTGSPVISNFSNRESIRFLGKDIRYLKTQNIHFQSYKDIFFGSFLYVMAYLMLTVLFIVFFIIYRKQVKENANIALVRTKKANKTAVRRLKQAEKLLKENKEEAFYEEVLRALWGYLSDKLNIPQSELTKDNVASELTKHGVNETLSGEFLEIIHTCEYARYAPSKTLGAMDKLFGETINAIDTMENTIKK